MSRSGIVDVEGPVHYTDHGGDGRAMLLIHGLGGSHANWTCVGPALSEHHRVYALDLIGFGVTPPAGRKMTVDANVDMIAGFASHVSPDRPVTLVGNSMGGMIALLAAARHPDLVSALVLIAPAVPMPSIASVDVMAAHRIAVPLIPGVGRRVIKAYNRTTPVARQLHETLAMVCADPSRIPDEGVEATMAMMELRREMPWAADAFGEAGRSVAATMARRKAFRETVHRIAAPTLLIHGEQDRIVPAEASERLADERPEWDLRILDGVGHVPPLEAPDATAELMRSWLGAQV